MAGPQQTFYVPAESSVKALGLLGGLHKDLLQLVVELVGAHGEDWANLSLVCKSFQFVVSDWRFKSFKAVTLSAASPEKALYFGARLPPTHPNHPRFKHASELLIHLEEGTDDLGRLQDLLLNGRSITSVFPALERLVFSTVGSQQASAWSDASALLAAMDPPPSVLLVLESFAERVSILSVDGLPSTLQRLAIMHSPTSTLTGALPAQLKHLEVLLVPFEPQLTKYTTPEEIAEAARSCLEMMPQSQRNRIEGAPADLLAEYFAMCENESMEDSDPALFPLSIIPPSLEELVLLFNEDDVGTLILHFDEDELGLELPALPAPPEDEEEDEVEPPQDPLERLANGLDEKYKFTGSLQHATSLRLVHCKVLYAGEVPTHSPLELDRLRDYVSSRCKAAATVVFQVSSVKKSQ